MASTVKVGYLDIQSQPTRSSTSKFSGFTKQERSHVLIINPSIRHLQAEKG